MCPTRLASYQFGFVYVKKVCLQHIWLLEKSWGLRSLLESPTLTFFVWHFQRWFQSCLQMYLPFPRKLMRFSPPDLLGGHHYFLWDADIWPLVSQCSSGIIIPCYLFHWGFSKVLGGTSLSIWEMSWEVFCLPFCFVFLWQRRSLRALFPNIWRVSFYIRLSSCSMRRRE